MNCPKCQARLKTNHHRALTDKMLTQPYFFYSWLVCSKCRYVQHFEDRKVYNQTSYFKRYGK